MSRELSLALSASEIRPTMTESARTETASSGMIARRTSFPPILSLSRNTDPLPPRVASSVQVVQVRVAAQVVRPGRVAGVVRVALAVRRLLPVRDGLALRTLRALAV